MDIRIPWNLWIFLKNLIIMHLEGNFNLLIISLDGTIKIWDQSSMKIRDTLTHEDGVIKVMFRYFFLFF
jgi:WD40 repeat protein